MNRGKAAKRAPLYAGDEVWKQVWDRIDPPGLREAWQAVGARISGQPLHQIHVTCWDVGSEVTRRLEYDVSDALHTRAWEYVGEPVLRWIADRLGPMVWADVWPDLRERFGGHVLLKDLLKDYGLEEFFVRVPREVSRLGWHHEWEEPFQAFIGQDSIRSLALYDGLVRLGVNVGEPLDGLVQVARSAGWWYPLEHAAILTERPPVLHLDAEGRLHHPTGPAAVYPDGFAVRARHGKVAPPR